MPPGEGAGPVRSGHGAEDFGRTQVVDVLVVGAGLAGLHTATLLARGGQPATALQEAARLGSTGQLYHHLKALTASGVVEQDKRGSYRLRTAATVPVLVLLTAASDVAGQLDS